MAYVCFTARASNYYFIYFIYFTRIKGITVLLLGHSCLRTDGHQQDWEYARLSDSHGC